MKKTRTTQQLINISSFLATRGADTYNINAIITERAKLAITAAYDDILAQYAEHYVARDAFINSCLGELDTSRDNIELHYPNGAPLVVIF